MFIHKTFEFDRKVFEFSHKGFALQWETALTCNAFAFTQETLEFPLKTVAIVHKILLGLLGKGGKYIF